MNPPDVRRAPKNPDFSKTFFSAPILTPMTWTNAPDNGEPFMHWLAAPCYASEVCPSSTIYVIEQRALRYRAPIVVGSPSAWGELAAWNLANAYRPEGT